MLDRDSVISGVGSLPISVSYVYTQRGTYSTNFTAPFIRDDLLVMVISWIAYLNSNENMGLLTQLAH